MAAKRIPNPAVCIIRHNYYPDSHVRRDAEALARAGHEVHVIALRRPGQAPREVLQDVTVHRLPVEHHRGTVLRYAWEYLSFAFLACLTVARLHLRRRFRVVEVDNMPDVLVFSAIVPKLLGAKVILYIFDNMPELLQVIWKVKPRHPLVRILAWMERLSVGFADRVIVSQETARRVVVARGVPESKVSVVLNSADEAIFHPRPRLVQPQPTGPFEIVTHGAILERYGVQTLLDAVPLLAKQGLDVRVQVFGEGEYRKSLEAQARRIGVADRVIFRGFVPQDELLATLARADLGYVGMLCDLMLSNKLVEYVSLGIPVVVPRWPTFQHYFPEETVTYYDAGDVKSLVAAILAVAHNPAEARLRATRATAIYQGYRWSVQQEAYIGVHDDLMARSGTVESGSRVVG
jgi:glycosyltransferase involved in cell wall biosynthesis